MSYLGPRRDKEELFKATLADRVKHLEQVSEDMALTMGEIESKLTSIQQQLVGVSLKLNAKHDDFRLDIYLAAVSLGVGVFLVLKAMP